MTDQWLSADPQWSMWWDYTLQPALAGFQPLMLTNKHSLLSGQLRHSSLGIRRAWRLPRRRGQPTLLHSRGTQFRMILRRLTFCLWTPAHSRLSPAPTLLLDASTQAPPYSPASQGRFWSVFPCRVPSPTQLLPEALSCPGTYLQLRWSCCCLTRTARGVTPHVLLPHCSPVWASASSGSKRAISWTSFPPHPFQAPTSDAQCQYRPASPLPFPQPLDAST